MTKDGVTITEISKMRSRVTFQELLNTSDGQGGQSESWTNLSSNPTVWCYLRPTRSHERYFSQQIQYQRTHVAIVRYRTDLTNEMRMNYDNRVFQIKGIRNPDERKAFLILDLEENQGT
jgi:SPP1 family predicted phage head-tail adaptor